MRTRRSRTTAAMVLGLLASMTLTGPAHAVDIIDDPMQIDERVTQLIQTTNLLCWEMHRFHQQQPDYRESYRAAKEIWSQARQMQNALRTGPVETEILIQQVTEMNVAFTQVEKALSKWGPGDLTLVATNGLPRQRTVVTPGVGVDIPFVGVHVGGSRVVVTDDGPPQFERRRLHPNSRGSKRSLERELVGVRMDMNDLLEDAGVAIPPNSAAAPTETGPIPQPPMPESGLETSQNVVPAPAKIQVVAPNRK